MDTAEPASTIKYTEILVNILDSTYAKADLKQVLSRIFTNLSVYFIVEAGSAVSIATLRILCLLQSDFPSSNMGYFMGTVAPSY